MFIDQLESCSRSSRRGARARFLAGIEAVVKDQHSRVRVVTTLRADFYDRPLLYPGFADLMRSYIETACRSRRTNSNGRSSDRLDSLAWT